MSIKQHFSSGALIEATSRVILLTGVALAVHSAEGQQPVWTKPASAATSSAPMTKPANEQTSQPTTPLPLQPATPLPVQPVAPSRPTRQAAATTARPSPGVAAKVADQSVRSEYYKPVAGKKNKFEYSGPREVVELAPTPMLDQEGRQRLDPDGKPMFNPPIRQQRDKQGNPFFDERGRPVMQTASDLGYDEKGKKIHNKKEKALKMVSVAIERGTLTVDGMTGKAGLNYDIKDLRFIYIYTPWIGTTIISRTAFPGAMEQKNAFNDKTLTVTVEEHTLQIYSDRRLLDKKPESAFVAVDRSFKIPSTFPVMGYGETLRPPYAWPGSKENAALKGAVPPPPLPPSIRAVSLLQPCPPGQMRMPGRTPLTGENLQPSPCVNISGATPGVSTPKPLPSAALRKSTETVSLTSARQ